MSLPFFSIVILTRTRATQLADCKAAIAKLDYPSDRIELIVIDDDGVDSLGPGRARNAGAAKAAGDYLAFTGDDCRVDTRWLREMAAVAQRTPGAAIAGT